MGMKSMDRDCVQSCEGHNSGVVWKGKYDVKRGKEVYLMVAQVVSQIELRGAYHEMLEWGERIRYKPGQSALCNMR